MKLFRKSLKRGPIFKNFFKIFPKSARGSRGQIREFRKSSLVPVDFWAPKWGQKIPLNSSGIALGLLGDNFEDATSKLGYYYGLRPDLRGATTKMGYC